LTNAKIERVNLEYNTWHDLLLALAAGFSLWILTWLQDLEFVPQMTAKLPEDQLLIRNFITSLTLIGSFFAFLLLIEIAKKIQITKAQMERIRKV
jgi:hypothetical protein